MRWFVRMFCRLRSFIVTMFSRLIVKMKEWFEGNHSVSCKYLN